MADMKPQGTQAYGIETGYEHGDANISAIVALLGIVITSTLVVMASMFGMFNYMNRQMDKRDAGVAVALTRTVIPPAPRLLPSPYTDRYKELDNAKQRFGVSGDTPDGLPWDKRTLEIDKQDEEANPAGSASSGNRIPIAAAMEIQSGAAVGKGTPAVMAWQESYPARTAGTTKGSLNLVPGTKKVEPSIFDNRPAWESPDEKFNTDSSGGLTLEENGGGNTWSR